MIAKDLPTGVSATPLSASPNLFSMLKPEGCFSFPSARTRSKFLGEACRAESSGCAALSRCISHCSASAPAALTSPSFHPPARPAPSAEKFSLCRTHWILLDPPPGLVDSSLSFRSQLPLPQPSLLLLWEALAAPEAGQTHLSPAHLVLCTFPSYTQPHSVALRPALPTGTPPP